MLKLFYKIYVFNDDKNYVSLIRCIACTYVCIYNIYIRTNFAQYLIIFNNGINNNFSLRTNYYTYGIVEKILKTFNTNG